MDTFRREIYMAALKELKSAPSGICHALCKSIPGVPQGYNVYDAAISPILPDWYSLAPERCWDSAGWSCRLVSRNGFWWSLDMHAARIRFLEQLLSDTHGTF